MRFVPAALQAHLDEGATTLCHCWKLTRKDGHTLGFTDHDRPVAFDGITFEPQAGFEPGTLESATGLAIDNIELLGALTSDLITDTALESGAFDGAEIDMLLVNWADPAQRVLLFRGSIGETQRGALSFRAELRGLAHRLDQPMGRAFERRCDAELGDARCRVMLTTSRGSVTHIDAAGALTVSGFEDATSGDFDQGLLRWISGANAGTAQPIRRHADSTLQLWTPPPHPPQADDLFDVSPGCDKRFETCRTRYNNVINFRGFPHMPGDDWVTRYPGSTEPNDGEPLG